MCKYSGGGSITPRSVSAPASQRAFCTVFTFSYFILHFILCTTFSTAISPSSYGYALSAIRFSSALHPALGVLVTAKAASRHCPPPFYFSSKSKGTFFAPSLLLLFVLEKKVYEIVSCVCKYDCVSVFFFRCYGKSVNVLSATCQYSVDPPEHQSSLLFAANLSSYLRPSKFTFFF